jgi:hypothetical protein
MPSVVAFHFLLPIAQYLFISHLIPITIKVTGFIPLWNYHILSGVFVDHLGISNAQQTIAWAACQEHMLLIVIVTLSYH